MIAIDEMVTFSSMVPTEIQQKKTKKNKKSVALFHHGLSM